MTSANSSAPAVAPTAINMTKTATMLFEQLNLTRNDLRALVSSYPEGGSGPESGNGYGRFFNPNDIVHYMQMNKMTATNTNNTDSKQQKALSTEFDPNCRYKPSARGVYPMSRSFDNVRVDLRPYQQQSIDALGSVVDGYVSGGIDMECGMGKTFVAAAVAKAGRAVTLINCNNCIAMDQTAKELCNCGFENVVVIHNASTINGWKVGQPLPNIILCTYSLLSENLERFYDRQQAVIRNDKTNIMMAFLCMLEWSGQFSTHICDEYHVLPAERWRNVCRLPSKWRVGFSGTMVREDNRIEELNALVGPVRFVCRRPTDDGTGIQYALWTVPTWFECTTHDDVDPRRKLNKNPTCAKDEEHEGEEEEEQEEQEEEEEQEEQEEQEEEEEEDEEGEEDEMMMIVPTSICSSSSVVVSSTMPPQKDTSTLADNQERVKRCYLANIINPFKINAIVTDMCMRPTGCRFIVYCHSLDVIQVLTTTLRDALCAHNIFVHGPLTGKIPNDQRKLAVEKAIADVNSSVIVASKVLDTAINIPNVDTIYQVALTDGSRQQEEQRIGRGRREVLANVRVLTLVVSGTREADFAKNRQQYIHEKYKMTESQCTDHTLSISEAKSLRRSIMKHEWAVRFVQTMMGMINGETTAIKNNGQVSKKAPKTKETAQPRKKQKRASTRTDELGKEEDNEMGCSRFTKYATLQRRFL